MDDKARQHIVSAFIIILLLICVFSPFLNFPVEHAVSITPSVVNVSSVTHINVTSINDFNSSRAFILGNGGSYMNGYSVQHVGTRFDGITYQPDWFLWVNESNLTGGIHTVDNDVSSSTHGGGSIAFSSNGTLYYTYGGYWDIIPGDLYRSNASYDLFNWTKVIDNYVSAVGGSSVGMGITQNDSILLIYRDGSSDSSTTGIDYKRFNVSKSIVANLDFEIYDSSNYIGSTLTCSYNWMRFDPRFNYTFQNTNWKHNDNDPDTWGGITFLYTDDNGDIWRFANGTDASTTGYPLEYDDADVPYDNIVLNESFQANGNWENGITPDGTFFQVLPGVESEYIPFLWFMRYNGASWDKINLSDGSRLQSTYSFTSGTTLNYTFVAYVDATSNKSIRVKVSTDDGLTWSDSKVAYTSNDPLVGQITSLRYVQPRENYTDDYVRLFYARSNVSLIGSSARCGVSWVKFKLTTETTNATGIQSIPRVNPSGITDVGNTTANATMTITNGYNCSYGVWYGTTFPVDENNADGNISSTGPEKNQTDGVLTSSITGLTAGQLYYSTAWVSNPSGFYNSSHYNYSFANYSYNINSSGWYNLTFPHSIWDNNQSVDDAEDGDERIIIETFLNITGILDDVEWIFRVSDLKNWNKGAGGNTLKNVTYNEEYYIKFFNATNISFLFDSGANYDYLIRFPNEIFDYNSSVNSNNTPDNFCQQGGIYDDVDWIFELPSAKNWNKGAGGNTLNEISSQFQYTFLMLNYTANLDFIYDKANANSTFLTRPNIPTNFSMTFNTTNAVLTWDKNSAANNTIITVKINSASTSPTDGDVIYNDTGETYTDTYTDYGNRFYTAWSYIRWSYNPILWITSSGSASANTTYVVDPPYNGASVYHTDTNYLNLTWSRGNKSDQEVVVARNDTYSTSATQSGNWIRQNGTNLYWNDTESSSRYYTIWSYNVTNNTYSVVGLDIDWGALGIDVFNESNMAQAIVGWNIEISDSQSEVVYTATNQTNTLYINLNDIPFGTETIFFITADGYRERILYFDLVANIFNDFDFYLPPYTTPTDEGGGDPGGGGEPDCEIRSYIDSIAITDSTSDATINLTYTLDDLIRVELYNDSFFGTYGSWIFISADNYSFSTSQVIINQSILDVNMSMARVTYYYEDCDDFVTTHLYRFRVIDEYLYPVAGATVQIRRYNNFTGQYINISTLLTNGFGEEDIWLIPSVHYRAFVSISSFDSDVFDWIPDATFYGPDYPKVFQITRTLGGADVVLTFWDVIQFNATMFTNGSLFVNYNDFNTNTTNAQFYTYEMYNFSSTFIASNSTTNNTFSFWLHGLDNSRQHEITIYLNHTVLGFVVKTISISSTDDAVYELEDIEEKISGGFGPFELGYVATFFIYIPVILFLTLAGKGHPGFAIISATLYAGFITTFVVVGNVFYIIPFAIAIGIMLMVVKGGKLKL